MVDAPISLDCLLGNVAVVMWWGMENGTIFCINAAILLLYLNKIRMATISFVSITPKQPHQIMSIIFILLPSPMDGGKMER